MIQEKVEEGGGGEVRYAVWQFCRPAPTYSPVQARCGTGKRGKERQRTLSFSPFLHIYPNVSVSEAIRFFSLFCHVAVSSLAFVCACISETDFVGLRSTSLKHQDNSSAAMPRLCSRLVFFFSSFSPAKTTTTRVTAVRRRRTARTARHPRTTQSLTCAARGTPRPIR
jgi:hypothetical protein